MSGVVKSAELAPATELVIAALQFLNHGAAARKRLADAVMGLPEPLAALDSNTLLALRQAAAAAVRVDGAGAEIVGGRRGAGLARMLLDRALRGHCRHLRGGMGGAQPSVLAFGQLLGQAVS